MSEITRLIQLHLDRYEEEHGPQKWDRALHVGAGLSKMRHPTVEWVNVDHLDELEDEQENTYDLIVGWHVLEHISADDYLNFLERLHRLAKPDALAIFEVPHGGHNQAWENPTHVRAFFPVSFGFFGQPFYWREDYGYKGDYRIERIEVNVPSMHFHQNVDVLTEKIRTFRNIATAIRGYMRVVKPIREASSDLQEPINLVYVEESS